ncbi:MAG: hypothetical protein ACRDHO_05925 [Actinomycetota bacterium]
MPTSPVNRSEISRRSMLKRLGAASVVTWTAPVITSMRAPAYAQNYGGFDYGSCGWRYKQVAHGGDPGFESGPEPPGFASGCAAFASDVPHNCPLPHQTNWDVETDMLLRRSVRVPVGTTDVTVGVAIDNDFFAYWDGNQIGSGVHDGCAEPDSFVFGAPPTPGEYLLAVRGIDRGGETHLDVRLTIS